MGEHIDRLVALSGVEHVKSYRKKDGTQVSAHLRDGEHGKGVFKVGDRVRRRGSNKVWQIGKIDTAINTTKHEPSATSLFGHPEAPVHFLRNPETGKLSGNLAWKFADLKRVSDEDAQTHDKARSAVQALKDKHTSTQQPQKPSQSQSQSLAGKVVKYSEKRPNPKHPKPIESDTIDGRRVVDRRLKQLADGSFKWEYLLGKTDTLKAEWVAK